MEPSEGINESEVKTSEETPLPVESESIEVNQVIVSVGGDENDRTEHNKTDYAPSDVSEGEDVVSPKLSLATVHPEPLPTRESFRKDDEALAQQEPEAQVKESDSDSPTRIEQYLPKKPYRPVKTTVTDDVDSGRVEFVPVRAVQNNSHEYYNSTSHISGTIHDSAPAKSNPYVRLSRDDSGDGYFTVHSAVPAVPTDSELKLSSIDVPVTQKATAQRFPEDLIDIKRKQSIRCFAKDLVPQLKQAYDVKRGIVDAEARLVSLKLKVKTAAPTEVASSCAFGSPVYVFGDLVWRSTCFGVVYECISQAPHLSADGKRVVLHTISADQYKVSRIVTFGSHNFEKIEESFKKYHSDTKEMRNLITKLIYLESVKDEKNREFCDYARRYFHSVSAFTVDNDIHALKRTLRTTVSERAAAICASPFQCIGRSFRSMLDATFAPLRCCCFCQRRNTMSIALESVLSNTEGIVEDLSAKHRNRRAITNQTVVDTLSEKLAEFL